MIVASMSTLQSANVHTGHDFIRLAPYEHHALVALGEAGLEGVMVDVVSAVFNGYTPTSSPQTA